MMRIPKISVIILSYHVDKYLAACLDSVVSQTLRDIEIICVDDGSKDRSVDILREYAEADHRIRIIRHEENRGRHQARKSGVAAATGEYLLFLDGDDAYAGSDALAWVYDAVRREDVDVLQFGIRIIPEYAGMDSSVQGISRYHLPYEMRVEQDAETRLRYSFVEHRWSMNLWDKIYRTELVQKAYDLLPERKVDNAEDLYAFFAIMHFCRAYQGIQGPEIYNYHLGRGLYGKPAMTMAFFEKLCCRHQIIDALYTFAEQQRALEAYTPIIEEIDRGFLADTIGRWLTKLPTNEKKEGFDLLCGTWPAERVIAGIAKRGWNKRAEIAKAVRGAESLKFKKRRVKTIAVYYHWMTIGGVERVISMLLPDWLEMGYRVILITDTEPDERDYALPEGVRRIVIPDWREIDKENYEKRAQALAGILKENGVDLVDYNAWNCPLALWDMLVIKAAGVAVNYHTHNVFTEGLEAGSDSIACRYGAAGLMDSVAALSRADAQLYRCINANVHYISNPLCEKEIAGLPQAPLHEKTILWVGRISAEKRPLEVVEVFKLVHARVPDAKLIILGDGDQAIKEDIRRMIAENQLENHVIMPGAVHDVQAYYLRAGAMIMTSMHEGHPMVLQESLSYGVPVVLYRMDYLELVRQCPGIISVDQCDQISMAEALIRLLENEEERKERGAQVRREILKFAENSRVREKWEALFASVENGGAEGVCDESLRILMDTLFEQMTLGMKKKNEELSKLKKACKEEKRKLIKEREEKKRILSGRAYRLGRLMGLPVRLLRRLIKR